MKEEHARYSTARTGVTRPTNLCLLELAEFWQSQRHQQKNYEKPKDNNHNNTHGAWLLRVFVTNPSGQSGARRVLSRVHDSGRLQRASKPHQRRWKYRGWLAFAVF